MEVFLLCVVSTFSHVTYESWCFPYLNRQRQVAANALEFNQDLSSWDVSSSITFVSYIVANPNHADFNRRMLLMPYSDLMIHPKIQMES